MLSLLLLPFQDIALAVKPRHQPLVYTQLALNDIANTNQPIVPAIPMIEAPLVASPPLKLAAKKSINQSKNNQLNDPSSDPHTKKYPSWDVFNDFPCSEREKEKCN
jgi:hypothetical protein